MDFEATNKTNIFKIAQFSVLGVQYFNPEPLPATRIHAE